MKIISKHICESRKAIKRITKTIVFLFIVCVLISCNGDDKPERVERTTFVYFPWTNNLTNYFYDNIADMEQVIKTSGLNGGKVLVFLATSATEAQMFEIVCKDGTPRRSVLKTYTNPQYTTQAGITSILNDVKRFAPAESYAMIIGSHGMGWLPVADDKSKEPDAAHSRGDYECSADSRFFGGLYPEYQTDISTLAGSIDACGMFMEYILFSGCYMSSLEAAYELRNVTKHIIASPTEVMAIGMPYREMGKYLFAENPDYRAICKAFYGFYSSYEDPFGTLAVIDCGELDGLAALMKCINQKYTFDTTFLDSIQRMDGYNPVLFYDYGDYVKALCGQDSDCFAQFTQQINRVVPYKVHTESFYSATYGVIPIKNYSGITTSEPSTNSEAQTYNQTQWYKDTH